MLINCPSEELRRRCKSVGYSEVLGIGQNFSLSSLRRSLRRQVFWHFFKSQASSSLATQSSSWWASRKKNANFAAIWLFMLIHVTSEYLGMSMSFVTFLKGASTPLLLLREANELHLWAAWRRFGFSFCSKTSYLALDGHQKNISPYNK